MKDLAKKTMRKNHEKRPSEQKRDHEKRPQEMTKHHEDKNFHTDSVQGVYAKSKFWCVIMTPHFECPLNLSVL